MGWQRVREQGEKGDKRNEVEEEKRRCDEERGQIGEKRRR